MNVKLDLETIIRILAVAVWSFGAFGATAPVLTANQAPVGQHALLLGLALYAAAPIIGGWLKPKTP